MTESVAVTKVAVTQKDSSPTKSDISSHRVQHEPKRHLGSLRSVINTIRHDGGTPSVDSIATELSGIASAERASVLLALQQTHGNRYVQRVVVGIQAKLKVGQLGDKYEQEADRVADAVMRMPERQVQRQAEEEEKEEEEIQTKPLPSQTSEVVSDVETSINSIRGGGQPLPGSTRAFFETRFGQDFSQVRLHTDARAADAARAVNARAFTTGQDVVFGAGQYAPGTEHGRRLMAHELTHVIQQYGGVYASTHSAYAYQSAPQSPGRPWVISPLTECPAKVVQRDLEEAFLQIPEGDRPFESGEQGLQQFQSIITDFEDFENVALSYDMRPAELLAMYMQEGGLMLGAHSRPTSVAARDRTALVAYYLWTYHGMDDFARTYPKGSQECLDMDYPPEDNCPNWSALGSNLRHQFQELYCRDLLWDRQGFRPSDPANQLAPADAISQLTSRINASGKPTPDFVRYAYRVVAASVTMRRMPAPRGRGELRQLGLSEVDIFGEDVEDVMEIISEEEPVSQTGDVVYPEVEALLGYETVGGSGVEATAPPTPSRRLGLRYRELEIAQEQLARARRRGDQRTVQQLEVNIHDLMERAFSHRFPVAVARLSMGARGSFPRALTQVHGQFQTWNRLANRESREALSVWALDQNALIMSRRPGNEVRILEQIGSSISEETVPLRRIRTDLTRFVAALVSARDFNGLRALFCFIISQVGRYYMENTQDWIEALTDQLPPRGVIPLSLYNHLTPPTRLSALPRQLHRSMRRFGHYRRFSEEMIEERLQREAP